MRINQPVLWQRLEGLAIFISCVLLADNFVSYGRYSWWALLLGLFVPDFSMLGYLAGPRVGATVYNLAHNYVFPVLALLVAMLVSSDLLWVTGLVWTAHIAMDRMFGYGLKLPEGFGHTHLGIIGVKQPRPSDH
ncbi:MAG TPA: DUF4260 domain-containing protein [Candidatus Saccharimonadia bacterium]